MWFTDFERSTARFVGRSAARRLALFSSRHSCRQFVAQFSSPIRRPILRFRKVYIVLALLQDGEKMSDTGDKVGAEFGANMGIENLKGYLAHISAQKELERHLDRIERQEEECLVWRFE